MTGKTRQRRSPLHRTRQHRGVRPACTAIFTTNQVESAGELEQALWLTKSAPGVTRPSVGVNPRLAIEHIERLVEHWSRLVGNTSSKAQVPSDCTIRAPRTSARCPWANPVESSVVPPALIPFGSYALGVQSADSDLDLLVLSPPSIKRENYFSELVRLLESDSLCHHVQPIPSAYTPVIKFVFLLGGVGGSCTPTMLPVDLVFARVTNTAKLVRYHLQKKNCVAEYTLDDTDLDGLDEEGIRSLNGARVSQMILRSVPDVAKFREVLSSIKHWAQLRGIYSNSLGFLGGVSWAIMVSYVCKTSRPYASSAEMIRSFFALYTNWDWRYPLLLDGAIAHVPPITNVSLQTRALDITAWDPVKNPSDGRHLMQIITPAYPSMNSSFNVRKAQLRRIQDELNRTAVGLKYQRQRRVGLQQLLFSPTNFFNQHREFVRVTIAADNGKSFVPWFRWVETKLRCLICSLETEQIETRPFSRFFDSPCQSFEKRFYVALRVKDNDCSANINATIQALQMDFLHQVNQWTDRTPDMSISIATTTEIPPMTAQQTRVVVSVDKHDEQSIFSESTAPTTDDEEDDSVGSVTSLSIQSS